MSLLANLPPVDPFIALGVGVSTAVTDAAYVFFNAAVGARKRVAAATWSSRRPRADTSTSSATRRTGPMYCLRRSAHGSAAICRSPRSTGLRRSRELDADAARAEARLAKPELVPIREIAMNSRRDLLGGAILLAAMLAVPAIADARQGPRLRYQRRARVRCGRFGCRGRRGELDAAPPSAKG